MPSRLLATLAALALLLTPARALASPDTPEVVPSVNMTDALDRLVVLEDADRNIVVIDPADTDRSFFGTRERVWQLQVIGGSSAGDSALSVTARDFRTLERYTHVIQRDDAYEMSCDDATRPLRRLPDAEARALVKALPFHEHRWRRNAVALFRDEFGVYYYVDRATGDDTDADHRVYIGWRGQMLRAPMALVASDSLGRVWAAANGARRLVVTNDQARYVEGSVERVLYALDLEADGPFLYGNLGVYGAAPHGTPCDALLPKQGG